MKDALPWLRACLWLNVPAQIERFDAAVARLRSHGPRVVCGNAALDLAELLPAKITVSDAEQYVVVTSWALTYVLRERRPAVVAAGRGGRADNGRSGRLADRRGRRIRSGAEVGSLGTVLALQTGREARVTATVHPYAEWVRPFRP